MKGGIILTFSSRNVATVSTHSRNDVNQLRFRSAFSTMVRISFSFSSSASLSSAKFVMEVVFAACDKVSCVKDWLRRLIAASSVGRAIGGGTKGLIIISNERR